MYPVYYALRRLNPFRGVVQIVEAGESSAHSYDGVTWHIRSDDGFGWVRPSGIWIEGEGLRAGPRGQNADIVAALETRPTLPFRLADNLELWLLDKQGLPMAQLVSDRASRHVPAPIEPEWQPFVRSYLGFHSPTLAAQGVDAASHRDTLASLINRAVRPYPAAQWFKRKPDGTGEGLEGLRLAASWPGRRLDAVCFPELLVRAPDNNPLEQSVISDYHAWVAPLLLLLPDLSDATRRRIEAQAVLRPQWLYRVHRLIPSVLDPQRLNAALVAARLEAASLESADSGPENLF